MVGPVLYQEMMIATRRNRVRIFRYCYALWILLGPAILALVLLASMFSREPIPTKLLNQGVTWYVGSLVVQNYLVLLLAAPVLTAGAITDEKWRGTLQYLLVTELFSWEILVGKLIARMHTVLMIALVPLPWLGFLGIFGGVDPMTFLMLCVTSVMLAFSLGAMSLLASVLCRNTRDAILGFYTVGAILLYGGNALWGLLAASFSGPPTGVMAIVARAIECLDPFQPAGPNWADSTPDEQWVLLLTSVLTWGALGLFCLTIAALWLRASYLRYLQSTTGHSWGPIVFAWLSACTLLGIVAFVVYALVIGELANYLDGTAAKPLGRAFRSFLAVWDGVTLLPLAVLIGFLVITGRSTKALDAFHEFRQNFWLTRRARIQGDPLRWKECHLEGLAPLAFLRRMPRWLAVALILLTTTASSLFILARSLETPYTAGGVVRSLLNLDFRGIGNAYWALQSGTAASGFFWQGIFVLLIATLVIGVRCSGAVTQEREKNTWEALLLTPLETRQLIRSKLWGIIGASLPYLAAFALPSLGLALIGGIWPVFWVVLWLAVTLLAMAFIGSAGLWCSVRSPGSLWSLLGTLGIGYVGGFLLYCVTFFFGIFASCFIMMFLAMIDQYLGTRALTSPRVFVDSMWIVSCVLLAGSFVLMTWRFAASAEYRVGILERTKHWRDEAKHPRWSRYAREKRRRVRYEDED